MLFAPGLAHTLMGFRQKLLGVKAVCREYCFADVHLYS
jgi:hypothetical protein